MVKTAIVTGSARGIGAAICTALRADGFEVYGLDLAAADPAGADPAGGDPAGADPARGNPADADPAGADLPDAYLPDAGLPDAGLPAADVRDDRAHTVLAADVTDPASVARALSGLTRIDVLVNNAGVMIEGALADMPLDAFDRQIAVNLRGPFVVTQAALGRIPEGGTILNVASELAYLGRAGASAYAATKGAILSLTRSWARELAPRITVNAVAPGPVDTPLLGYDALSPGEQAQEKDNPLGRIGQPHEIAAVVAFLASDKARFITGQCYSADGGAAMH